MSGRIRSIKPEILEAEKTADLDDHTWRLFVSLFCLADDYGNLRGSADWLHGQVFWRTPEAIEKTRVSLATLSRLSLVTPYEVSGQVYLAITNWSRHQRVDKPGKPRVPGPNQGRIIGQNEDSRESPESLATVQESPSLACAPARGPDPDHDQRPTTAEGAGGMSCPDDLTLDERQAQSLSVTPGIPTEVLAVMVSDLVGRWSLDQAKRMPSRTRWAQALRSSVLTEWSDPTRRRRAIDAAKPTQEPPAPRRADGLDDIEAGL